MLAEADEEAYKEWLEARETDFGAKEGGEPAPDGERVEICGGEMGTVSDEDEGNEEWDGEEYHKH